MGRSASTPSCPKPHHAALSFASQGATVTAIVDRLIANEKGAAVRRLILVLATLALSLSSVAVPGAAAAGLPTTLIKGGFTSPTYLTNAGDSRLFVVERPGYIKIIKNDNSVVTFLDIHGLVSQAGGEEGLLGLAFDPSYSSNGLFYIWYTPAGSGAEILAEYQRSAGDADAADPASARQVLRVTDPYTNHNGGWLAFKGGYLYLSTGDGGSAGDPQRRAQNLDSLWGKILRIDPHDPAGSATYAIPGSNPFVGRTGRDEVWSYGLRNPWRCSFDDMTGKLWCGDVGQDKFEEVDRVRTGKGINFGWRLLEGRHYYKYPNRTAGNLCTSGCKTMPIAEYAHGAFGGGNCAVTGGYVSRRAGAALEGKYVFGDYCSGKVWVIPSDFAPGTLPTPVADTDFKVSSFGEGADGRIYLVDLNGGIYLLDES
jgi:glucose/arabinose dehydrogenase